ncbi:MAG: discoidin protein, partial [Paenibacillus sp.]|nr:discoidin protein [Paenibacillus sp.]
MKRKLRVLICYLFICSLVPFNITFAAVPIDRNGDGIHIDDIVYYLSQTGSQSRSDLTHLLSLIGPIIPTLTAEEVAAGITSVTVPAADATSLTLPTVPDG